MANELNATCDICGKKYHMCQTCKSITSYQPWRTVTDTLSHYAIFLALSEYTKTKDKETAKEELSKCDLSELESFNDNIKAAIKSIMTEDRPTIKISKKEKSRKVEAEAETKDVEPVVTDGFIDGETGINEIDI